MAEGRKARITARELKMAVMVVLVLFCQAITTPTATPTEVTAATSHTRDRRFCRQSFLNSDTDTCCGLLTNNALILFGEGSGNAEQTALHQLHTWWRYVACVPSLPCRFWVVLLSLLSTKKSHVTIFDCLRSRGYRFIVP
eukprot:m.221941 g.221941  ORF g.221941 m.221941 type:complete len:140 (-) comp18729_c2_seq2:579-998(-)